MNPSVFSALEEDLTFDVPDKKRLKSVSGRTFALRVPSKPRYNRRLPSISLLMRGAAIRRRRKGVFRVLAESRRFSVIYVIYSYLRYFELRDIST